MTRFQTRVFALAVLAGGVAFLGESPAADDPAPGPLPAELRLVPPDAAVFAHFDFEAIWKSKIGESVRKMSRPAEPKPPATKTFSKVGEMKPKMELKKDGKEAPKPAAANLATDDGGKDSAKSFYEETVGKIRDATGIDPGMVRSVTLFFPKLKGPGDEASAVFIVTLSQAYDRKKLVAGLAVLDKQLADLSETEPGVFETAKTPMAEKVGPESGRRPADGLLRLVLTDPKRIIVTGPRYKGVPKPSEEVGPITPALREAASGKTVTLALNFAQFPEEIKGEDLPAEVRPFKPLIQSELAMGTATMKDGRFEIAVRIRTEDARKAGEAEKSLGAILTLGQVLIPQGLKELEKQKESEAAAFIPLLQNLLAGLNSAKTGVDGNSATLAMKLEAELPVGTVLGYLSGAVSPSTAPARAQSANNLKQLGLAMHNYHDSHGRFPAAAICDKKGKPLLSWRVAILPYIEQDALYKQFKLDEPWDSEHNKKLLAIRVKVFELPGMNQDGGESKTHYRVFTGKGCGFNQLQSARIQEITDGTSNTIMVVTAAEAVVWSKPDDLPFDPKTDVKKRLLYQNGVTQVGFFDGSVRAMKDTVSETTMKALITINGGEVVNPNDN